MKKPFDSRQMAGKAFAFAGFVFLLANAVSYLSGTGSRGSFVPIGIALVVIGAAISRSGNKAPAKRKIK